MKEITRFILAFILVVCPVFEVTSDDDLDKKELLTKKVQAVLRAKYSHEAKPRYRSLFKTAGADGLDALKRGPHTGIAIQAAWEQVALTVPRKETDVVLRPDRDALSRFLGFLEGRGRVNVPEWWADVVKDSRANRRDNIYPGQPRDMQYHEAGLDSARAPNSTTLARSDMGIQLTVSGESAMIPEEILEKSDDGRVCCDVTALMTENRCYVAVHEGVGYQYQLTCIDRSTTKTVWSSEVWSSWWGGSSGPPVTMFLEITEQNDRIVVFGSAWTGIHVEAFRVADGKNLFRFSNSY